MAFARWSFCLCLGMQVMNPSALFAQNRSEDNVKASVFYSEETAHNSRRSDFTRPVLSLFLPGFDQFISRQFTDFSIYAAAGISSLVLSAQYNQVISEYERSEEFSILSSDEQQNILTHDDRYRRLRLASQLYLVAGSLSAYQSFRMSALARQQIGEYLFLETEDSVRDILMAPFDLTYFTSTKTLLPLGTLTAIVLLTHQSEDYRADSFTRSDGAFAGAFSYNAGTSEEALFRGWLMPYFAQQTGSLFWSNMIQSSLFALAHTNQTSFPIFQFGLGYYLGWLTQHQGWSIKESIFIHTWWDVVAFAAEYTRKKKAFTPGQVVWLPALRLAF